MRTNPTPPLHARRPRTSGSSSPRLSASFQSWNTLSRLCPRAFALASPPDTLPQRSAWPAPSHYTGLSSRCCLRRGTSSIWLNLFSIAVAFVPKQQIMVHRSTCSQVCQPDSQLLDMGQPAYVLTIGFLMPGTEPGTLEARINIY